MCLFKKLKRKKGADGEGEIVFHSLNSVPNRNVKYEIIFEDDISTHEHTKTIEITIPLSTYMTLKDKFNGQDFGERVSQLVKEAFDRYLLNNHLKETTNG